MLAVATMLSMVLAADPPHPMPALPGTSLAGTPGVTGELRIHREMRTSSGEGLLPRHVSVWLPPGYALPENASRRYPVLYMHDGQNAFDPATAFLGREWHADEVATDAILRGEIPPVIIVGIWNTPERVSDYTPDEDLEEKRGDNKPQGRGGRGVRYLDWIVRELKPFIDSNYRTMPARETTAIMGSSLGGIISLAAAEQHADTFGCVAAVSPSLWWNKGSVIERWQKRTPDVCRLWVDMGDRERAGLTEALRAFETAARPSCGARLHVEVVPGGRHDEPSWSARLGRTLKFLFAETDWQRVAPPEPVPLAEAPKVAPPRPDARGAAAGQPAAKSPPD
jgi:predicted alpha/beta superfamily hydrolase